MHKIISYSIFLLLIINYAFAQQSYNLEVILRAHCPVDSMETFGISISSAGDLNADGYGDIVVGSLPKFWVGGPDPTNGHAYIYYGGPIMDSLLGLSIPGEHPRDRFGDQVAGLGDINADGYDDVAVSAPYCTEIDTCGRVYVYFGGPGMDTLPDRILKGTKYNELGHSIAAGDLNGDGWNDIAVGEYWWYSGRGRVYVYHGGPGFDTVPDLILNGRYPECFGMAVGAGGDVNADGYGDLVVGAPDNSESYGWAGKVYVFCGGNPMDTIPDAWLHGEEGGCNLGWFGCDILDNRSGYDAVITSTPFWQGNSYGRGKVYILQGGNPMDTIPDLWMTGQNDSSSLGMSCANAGDIDGDGYADAVVGAPVDNGFKGAGYCWLGGPTMDTVVDASLTGDYERQMIGWTASSAGDVNGDDRDEVMFSNYVADSNWTVWVCRYTGAGIEDAKIMCKGPGAIIGPNPFCNLLNIRLPISDGQTDCMVNIYDLSGKEVLSKKGIAAVRGISIKTDDLPAGVYFYRLRVNRTSRFGKVIKVK